METMSIIDIATMAREVNIRIIICVIAVEPRFESRERLYLMAMLG